MNFSTEVKCNDFKAFIETFFGWMKIMKEEIYESVKLARQKATKIYKAVHMESTLVFKIDDELIQGVDTPISADIRFNT